LHEYIILVFILRSDLGFSWQKKWHATLFLVHNWLISYSTRPREKGVPRWRESRLFF